MLRDSVLLVDDEPQVLLALDDILSDDFNVFKTASAAQALMLARERRDIAVVVTDQRMPETQGDELVAALASFSDATRILLTGYADIAAVVRAVNDGQIFAYVSKPWKADDLLHKVHKAAERFHMVTELARERQMLHDLMNSVPDGIFFKDRDLRFLRVNRVEASLLDAGAPEALVGKRLSDVRVDDPEALRVEAEERQVLLGTRALDVVRTQGTGPTRRWLSESKAVIVGPAGDSIGLVGIGRDITERKLQEDRIERLTRVHAVSSGINAAIVRAIDRVGLLEESCRIAVEVGKLDLAVVLEGNITDGHAQVLTAYPLDHRPIVELSESLRTQPRVLESWMSILENRKRVLVTEPLSVGVSHFSERATLAVFPLHVMGECAAAFCLVSQQQEFFDDDELEVLSKMTDNIAFGLAHISTAQRLDFLNHHDDLTALPKRPLFLDRVSQRINESRDGGASPAVLMIHIGRFQQINETLGRNAGDQLLVQVAARLRASVRERDTVARLDSNRFLVLSSGDQVAVSDLADSLLSTALKDCFVVSGTEVRVAAKLGIARFPDDGESGDVLIAHAEAALENAKRGLESYAFYAADMHDRASARLSLETRLRRAVEAEAFELYYQPKVEVKTGLVVGLEALLRWQDPPNVFVSPMDFIPLLEETGLIHEVGRWVLWRAVSQHASWKSAGLEPPRIAVNVSAIQLAASDLEQALRSCQGASESIDIEITESVFLKDLAGSVVKLQSVREQGLKVAIDDFGTGYSSLGYLSRLPIDALKIDRAFVTGMATNPQETSIVMTIISLAHALDLEVIAEGVETREQARLLRLLKCDQIQGYLVGKPQPADQIAHVLGRTIPIV